VTGQHGRRGSGRHDHGSHRFAQAPDRRSPDREVNWRSEAEVEDIATRGLAPATQRRGLPLGFRGTVAAVALVALLAIAGALSGRGPAGATPDQTVGPVAGTSGAPAPSTSGERTTTGPSPRVTPWVDCAPPSGDVPRVFLEVDGRPTELATGVAWQQGGSDAPSQPGRRGHFLVVVPSHVHTELWIEGGACANAWMFNVDGEDAGTMINVALDPGVAAQNRFELRLLPFAGRAVTLGARLIFPHLILEMAQPLRIEPFGYPVVRLAAADGVVQPVEGCDVVVMLANSYETYRSCPDDLPFPPGDVLVVDAGTRISFDIPGWILMGATATCGQLSGLTFVAGPEPGCSAELDVDPEGAGVGFTVGFEDQWTLAISACALEAEQEANRVCGTWFANVRVEA
jgi:hypothetical protein